ncbi:hypothetical protein MUU46_22530 [Scandinavium sp. TWS1a]|uniref:hypothetical protein n=1 Tax=Scandinavium tedordense TaxID=2926521 RepID=UPI002165A748|nr:hypothetical protein [Scandinavium tedordense]MCS2173061.1 hypothetical protein [Scandinavium tedordense]
MLSFRNHNFGESFISRSRELRARSVNNKMVQGGTLWFNNFVTTHSTLCSFALLIPGLKFGDSISDFTELANNNYRALQVAAQRLTDQEILFFDHFTRSDFYAAHATNSKAVINDNNDLVLFSRKKLIEDKIIFPTGNTSSDDIVGLANDDNVFFSLEVGAPPQKSPAEGIGSRFGNTIYKIPYKNPAFEHSSLVLFDQLEMVVPECHLNGISIEAKQILNSRNYTMRSICFYGRKSIPALALSIILAARLLPEDDRNILLKIQSEREINNLLGYLFRIEIRVPRLFGVNFGEYFKFNFGR